jgi:pimeloyl-ACP methyl ester carboxylesterase
MPRARANGIELEYESLGDEHAPPLLMIMGLASQLIVWPNEWCHQLAARGFRVIRYDNRDVGLSTRPDAPYTLDDMADDAAGLLDALDLPAAHVIGASMGGFIAQLLALRHPRRVRSLCIMMSSTGSRGVGAPEPDILPLLMMPVPTDRADYIEYRIKISRRLSSTGYEFDEPRIRRLAAAAFDRAFFPLGGQRQLAAVMSATDRTPRLTEIHTPTLVIHGGADPIVSVSGGEALARAIPNATLRLFPGMGHDLPEALWPTFTDAIAANAGLA